MATGPAAVADADAEALRVQAQVRADAEKRAAARAARSPTKTRTKSMGWVKAAQALTPNAQADDVKASSLPGGVKAFIKAAEELSPRKGVESPTKVKGTVSNSTMDNFFCSLYGAVLKALRCDGGLDAKYAICKISPNGKPCGQTALAPSMTPNAKLKNAPKNNVPQFAPAIAARVEGTVKLTPHGSGCLIEYDIVGLAQGAHGFHIHETADFSNGCLSAGGHFNPHGKDHGGLEDENRHVGDLGNIIADRDGRAKGKLFSNLVQLSGKFSVIGRSIMVHADPDDLGRGDNSMASMPGPPRNGFVSKITGNAGPRLACGEIKWPDAP